MPATLEVNNTYYGIRHALSDANASGIIIHDADIHPSAIGTVRDSVRTSDLSTVSPDELVVVTSPRRRCRTTTAEMVEALGLDPRQVEIHEGLDERGFGPLEGKPKSDYELVYAADRQGQTMIGIEPVTGVRDRIRRVVSDFEERYPTGGRTVVLVSHADPLEIFRADLLGLPPQAHRDRSRIPKAQNAEVIPLVRRGGGRVA